VHGRRGFLTRNGDFLGDVTDRTSEAAARPEGTGRIGQVVVDGRTGWIKRPETLRGRMRWQKGDPMRAFLRERQALDLLARNGMPVPEVIDEGPDYFVIEDAGPTLLSVLRDPDLPESGKIEAVSDAARALAGMHDKGFSHGRPDPKDICWDAGVVRFIDLERSTPSRNTPRGHVTDLLVFLFGLTVETGGAGASVLAARDAYIESGGRRIWERLVRRMRLVRLAWPILALVSRLLRSKREFGAIVPFMEFFRDESERLRVGKGVR
jgi:tRNA A-37 threonylcarbamoyl transferase component Bud32